MIDSSESIAGLAIYWAIIGLMMTGLYAVISRDNLVKKIMGLSLFQSSAILFYVAMGKVAGGTAPILIDSGHDKEKGAGASHGGEAADHGAHSVGEAAEILYSNPLPHVLMLTAIVVGVATLALALAMVVRIQDSYGTVEEDEIAQRDLNRNVRRALRSSAASEQAGS